MNNSKSISKSEYMNLEMRYQSLIGKRAKKNIPREFSFALLAGLHRKSIRQEQELTIISLHEIETHEVSRCIYCILQSFKNKS